MHVWTITVRELLVAARKPIHYWLRFFAALVACLVAGFILVAAEGKVGNQRVGMSLFLALSQAASLGCLAAGTFLTADCISSEKREGTLGLLFLTELKGWDVVLGKLSAAGMGGLYGLSALLPVLTLPIILGGVALGEMVRVWVLLFLTLFLALAMGLLISCGYRKEQSAIVHTGLTLVGLSYLLPHIEPWMGWMSPSQLILLTLQDFPLHPSHYYYACLGLFAAACILVLLAAWWSPHCWKERVVLPPLARYETASSLDLALVPDEPGGFLPRDTDQPTVHSVGQENPAQWLAERSSRSSALLWFSVVLSGIAWMMIFSMSNLRIGGAGALLIPGLGLHVVLNLWIAWEAGRRFTEDKRNGMLEILLSTPLSTADIIGGNMRFLYQKFVYPVMFMIGVDLALVVTIMGGGSAANSGLIVFEILGMAVLFLGECLALAWVGAWLSLKHRKSIRASIGALARILVVPGVLYLGALLAWRSAPTPAGFSNAWMLLVIWCGLGLANAIFWMTQARRNLSSRIREEAAVWISEAVDSKTSPARSV